MTIASLRLDRWVAARDRLNAKIAVAECDAEREYFAKSMNESEVAALQLPSDPSRPVAGSSITEHSMSNETDNPDQKIVIEKGRGADDNGLPDEVREFLELIQSRSARQAREITNAVLAAIEGFHPSVRDAVAHSALSFAVNRLADMHGGIFVQGRVAAILDAKFDG